MKNNLKKIITSLLVLTLVLVAVLPSTQAQAKETNKYLVLVQNKNKTWTAYKDLVYKTDTGALMVKASKTSKLIPLTYKKSGTKKIIISTGKKKITLTKGNKNYTYYNGTKNATVKASYAPITKNSTNYIHYATLGKLVNTKYFTGTKATDYKVNGYSGVIAYSKYNKITALPNINKVKDENNKPINDKKPVKPNNGKTINIGGIDIPLVDTGFKKPSEADTGRFGNDNDNNHAYYNAGANEFDDYIHKEMKGKKPVSDRANTVIFTEDKISVAFNGVHDLEYAFKLYKNVDKEQYELTIATRLGEKGYGDVADNSLKLLLAAFTNEVDSLYEAIYSEWEGDNIYNINKKDFVNIGSCKIKFVAGNREGTYVIKAK